jgi:hypothetical protein
MFVHRYMERGNPEQTKAERRQRAAPPYRFMHAYPTASADQK